MKGVKGLFTKFGGNRIGKTAAASSAVLLFAVPSAFASGNNTPPSTTSDLISTYWPDFVTLFTNTWNLLVSNPYTALLTTAGIAFLGFRLFSKAKKIAKK